MKNKNAPVVIGVERSNMERYTENTWHSRDGHQAIDFDFTDPRSKLSTLVRLRMPIDVPVGEHNIADPMFNDSICVFEFLVDRAPTRQISGTLKIDELDFTEGAQCFRGSFKLKAVHPSYPGIFLVDCERFEFTEYLDWGKSKETECGTADTPY